MDNKSKIINLESASQKISLEEFQQSIVSQVVQIINGVNSLSLQLKALIHLMLDKKMIEEKEFMSKMDEMRKELIQEIEKIREEEKKKANIIIPK